MLQSTGPRLGLPSLGWAVRPNRKRKREAARLVAVKSRTRRDRTGTGLAIQDGPQRTLQLSLVPSPRLTRGTYNFYSGPALVKSVGSVVSPRPATVLPEPSSAPAHEAPMLTSVLFG